MGCFCIGTNQVDLADAAARGWPSSTRRSRTPAASWSWSSASCSRWRDACRRRPSACTTGSGTSQPGVAEIRGRTLGIVGYGNIGTQAVERRRGDRYARGVLRHRGPARARQRPTGRLARRAARPGDVVSIVVTPAGERGAVRCRPVRPDEASAAFINASWGMVVDDEALRDHILSGHLSGAAIDVFPTEPKAQGGLVLPLRVWTT